MKEWSLVVGNDEAGSRVRTSGVRWEMRRWELGGR